MADDYEDKAGYGETYEEDESWWNEGLITLLRVAGDALFIFPEQVTSGLGIFLITIGVLG